MFFFHTCLSYMMLQKLVLLMVNSPVVQEVEDISLDKSRWRNFFHYSFHLSRFLLFQEANDIAWAAADELRTPLISKVSNNWEEWLLLLRQRALHDAKGQNQGQSWAQLEQMKRFYLEATSFCPNSFNVATLRFNTSLTITCNSIFATVLFSQSPLFSLLFLVYTEIFHLSSNLYLHQFHSDMYWQTLKRESLPCHLGDTEQKYHLFSSLVLTYFPGRISRYVKPFVCACGIYPATSQPQSVPCQTHLSNSWCYWSICMSESSQSDVTGTKLSTYSDIGSNVISIHPNLCLLNTVFRPSKSESKIVCDIRDLYKLFLQDTWNIVGFALWNHLSLEFIFYSCCKYILKIKS